jgi:hypothetical protein
MSANNNGAGGAGNVEITEQIASLQTPEGQDAYMKRCFDANPGMREMVARMILNGRFDHLVRQLEEERELIAESLELN